MTLLQAKHCGRVGKPRPLFPVSKRASRHSNLLRELLLGEFKRAPRSGKAFPDIKHQIGTAFG